ncbi:MAG: histidine kinase [Micrococcales bacterium]|nr:histidine kinase [Micrococcales bacterium]
MPPAETESSRGFAHPHSEDIAFAGGILVLFLLSVLASGPESLHWNGWAAAQSPGLRWTLTGITAFLMTGSLMWRRAKPLLVAIMILVGTMMHIAVFDGPNWMLVSTPLAIYSVTRWGSRRLAITTLILSWLGALRSATSWMWPVTWANAQLYGLVIALLVAMLLISYLLGRAARTNAEKAYSEATAAAQAEYLAHTRLRQDIARELHDVVAHSLSVMVVQAEGGQAAAPKQPQAAVSALETIARVGRESLGEMRHLVEILRDNGASDDDALAPHPTLGDIPVMVAHAGPRVNLQITGEPPDVPPTVNAVAYRLVQESLTNVLKHAGAQARAWVTIEYMADAISIDITDDGGGRRANGRPPQTEQGRGIQGMRERMLSVGGHLLTGPSCEGGFRVQAWLPIRGATAPIEDCSCITESRRVEALT